ncbi:gamma-glutamyltransferase [Salinithrix halophila]|uniref:Glutathione hydrolase proenzyme n=1 Tax=Salinithrix halophila TaxID=1485204 RepID=A0ABV8JIX9_9BACL
MSTRTLNGVLAVIVVLGMAGFYWHQSRGSTDSLDRLYRTSLGFGGKEPSFGVASAHPLATEVGMDVLHNGGNAVDAAIAVSYALGVVEPHGSGIGGGGTMMVYPGAGKEPTVYDYREISSYSGQTSPLAIGVPGFVKGMEAVHKDFGTRKMAELIEPSVRLASDGYSLTALDESRLENTQFRMPVRELPHMYPKGQPLKRGDILRQQELAQILELIQQEGADGFYRGSIAKELVRKAPSITLDDLARYRVLKKKPVKGRFAGYDVYAPPAPSGGIMMIQFLQVAEALKVEETKGKPSDFVHLSSEIYKCTYKDRLYKVGDPAFVQVPEEEMISKQHTLKLTKEVSRNQLSKEQKLELDSAADQEDHDNTTHFVVVDRDGMMVSATNTVSGYYGSGVYVKGFFLNNQLKNFSLSANLPNRFQPGKRPFSYTTPMILIKDGESMIGIGSAGGRKITEMVGQVLIRHLAYGQSIEDSLKGPRSYVDLANNTVVNEKTFPPKVSQTLMQRGYSKIKTDDPWAYGSVQTIRVDLRNGKLEGGADPRRDGTWRAEH